MRFVPIESAPKDRPILVNDTTGFAPWAVARWQEAKEWSGWVYEDEILSDARPLGPCPTMWLQGLDWRAIDTGHPSAVQLAEQTALARIESYVEQRAPMRGVDPNEVHTLHAGTDREVSLTLADLRLLVEMAKRA